ncbi:hypothetical protein BOTNAR_0089g00260 [Botryotinia narcissicola]|uniref:Uncharacterized protein n=1 Tax=Botryotinia narcissicola TaxID=278944 RepID=A0A4Z1J643_9HELO|nr:hypothetical protein BOTNAR_0089g00260 [Botryotinia narcissicola]
MGNSARSYRPALTCLVMLECGIGEWMDMGPDWPDIGCQESKFINAITFLVDSLPQLGRKSGCNAFGDRAIWYVKAVLRRCLIWKADALHAALSTLLMKALSALEAKISISIENQ